MALPDDELEVISKKLTFDPDYIRFRSVCKSWRSAAPKRPQLPWLILYDPINSNKNTCLVSFYQFCFETNKITQVPELFDSPLLSSFIDNSTVCLGSSRGWLAFISSEASSVLLFNPLTNSSIHLPNLSENAFVYSDSILYLTSDPSESLSDCFAVIYHSGISYCKVGSNAWIELTLDPCLSISNFCSYHGKHFFASDGDVYVCDFGPNSGVDKIISVILNDDKTSAHEIDFLSSWLVESDEDLLLVRLYYMDDVDSYYYRVLKLEVECPVPKSVELKNLGNRALFISDKTAFSLTSSKYSGCKESCVYTALIISEIGRPVQIVEVDNFRGLVIGRPVQIVEVDNFRGLVKNMRINNDSAPLNFGYTCDWFSPNLLL